MDKDATVTSADSALDDVVFSDEMGHDQADSQQESSQVEHEESGADDESVEDSTSDETPRDEGEGNDDELIPMKRLRGLQAAKDKELAEVRKRSEEATQAVELMQALILNAAIENQQRQAQALEAEGRLPEAERARVQADAIRLRAALFQEQQRIAQDKAAIEAQKQEFAEFGSMRLAHTLANDPRFKGHVSSEELLEWAPMGRDAMERYASRITTERKRIANTQRRQSKADAMGGSAGAGVSKYDALSGDDLIAAALRDGTDRRKR